MHGEYSPHGFGEELGGVVFFFFRGLGRKEGMDPCSYVIFNPQRYGSFDFLMQSSSPC